jgi:hypothetical protein
VTLCTAPPARALCLLDLLFVLIALTPLAYATPPDPAWITGFFDDDDNDNGVFFITSSVAILDPFPLDDSTPVSVHQPAPPGEVATATSGPSLSSADARASPIA